MSPSVFVLLTLCPLLLSAYQAPEYKEDIFASRPCPAFLVFDNVAYVSDMTVELPCHCKPADVLSVVWYYQKNLGPQNAKVLTDFSGTAITDSSKAGSEVNLRARFSIRLFSLLIFRSQHSDSGHYVCGTASGRFFYGYDVDIQIAKDVHFPGNVEHRSELQSSASQLFQVFTSYWRWSVCDRCDVQGEQVRVGLCYVTSKYLQVRYLGKVGNVTSCGSSAVPHRFGITGADHGAELSIRTCDVFCPSEPRPNPQREALSEFLGYDNPANPALRVNTYNRPANTDLVLTCPGAKPEHAVAWDKGSRALYRFQYMEGVEPNARVFIDVGHHLHFRPVKTEDKATYYCWIQGKKAAEIRLVVNTPLGRRRSITHPDALLGLSVLLLSFAVFTAVFLLMITGRFIYDLIEEIKASN